MTETPYGKWLKELNEECDRECGMGYEELPDLVDVWALFDAGVSPLDAARHVVEAAKGRGKGGAW